MNNRYIFATILADKDFVSLRFSSALKNIIVETIKNAKSKYPLFISNTTAEKIIFHSIQTTISKNFSNLFYIFYKLGENQWKQ